ncbi:MAG TPA: class I SAM-dependent methyltransferase [Gaiellales bacterium]|nr:class I SAM-dependent methyltransferase [Gaiellales bacterium]
MTDETGRVIADGYDRVADAYAALESPADPWPRMRRVKDFIVGLPDGSRLLDLGCGNGLPATRELSELHEVTAVDISPEQAARARRNAPRAEVLCADVRDLNLPTAAFDAIVALYLIDNVPAREYEVLFRRLAGWLRPGGRLLLSAEPAEAEEDGLHTWLGVPMLINGVPVEMLTACVEAAGLEVLDLELEEQREGGRPITFAWVAARRPD